MYYGTIHFIPAIADINMYTSKPPLEYRNSLMKINM